MTVILTNKRLASSAALTLSARPSAFDPTRRGRPALQLPESRRSRTAVHRCPALVKFKAPEPRGFARCMGNGLVDAADIPSFKESVVAFRIYGVGIALHRISIEATKSWNTLTITKYCDSYAVNTVPEGRHTK